MAYLEHKPLTFAFAKVSYPWSPCQQHHLAYISEFITNIGHVAGKDNHNADASSCALVSAIGSTELD